eukprot:5500048-Amphidinium_carterae.1
MVLVVGSEKTFSVHWPSDFSVIVFPYCCVLHRCRLCYTCRLKSSNFGLVSHAPKILRKGISLLLR